MYLQVICPPATIVAAVYSCHFPFVSIFLDVIHVLFLNDMQANNQIKDFKKKKKKGIHFLPVTRGCYFPTPTSRKHGEGKPSQRMNSFSYY